MMGETTESRAIGWLTMSSCFLLLSLPLLNAASGAYSWDQDKFHVPAILQIRQHWPAVDLVNDTFSAVAPGYHWLLAGASLLLGEDVVVLRFLNLAVSFLVLAVLYQWLLKRIGAFHGVLLIAPLAASNFFIKSSAWVVTDNASLLLVVTALIGILNTATPYRAGAVGIAAAVAVFVRQVNVWLAGPLLLRWFSDARSRKRPPARQMFDLVFLFSPLLVLTWLYLSWQGLVPQKWQGAASGFSLSGIAYLAVVFLIISFFYFGGQALAREVGHLDRRTLAAACVAGLVIATASPTTYSYAEGRWGGYLWPVAAILPELWGRSAFFLVLCPLGILAVCGVWRMVGLRAGSGTANLWMLSFVCWAASFLANRQVFHRYFEPTVLVFVIIAARLAASGPLGRGQRVRLAVLASIQAGVTLATAWARTF